MFGRVSLAAAFFLMVGTPLAGASESAQPIERSALHTSISLHESGSIVVAQDAQSSDSADSDNDSSDSSDDNDNENGDSEQSGGSRDQEISKSLRNSRTATMTRPTPTRATRRKSR